MGAEVLQLTMRRQGDSPLDFKPSVYVSPNPRNFMLVKQKTHIKP